MSPKICKKQKVNQDNFTPPPKKKINITPQNNHQPLYYASVKRYRYIIFFTETYTYEDEFKIKP